MYAILRQTPYDTERLASAEEALAEFQAVHAAQPGYAGNIVVDAGDGQRFTVTMWESENDAAAARAVLEPHVRRLLQPLTVGPSQLLGVGEVVTTDLTRQH